MRTKQEYHSFFSLVEEEKPRVFNRRKNPVRMGDNLSRLGGAIENAVKRYNEVVANVEGCVRPRARKFAEYELPGVEAEIAEAPAIEGAPRELRDDRPKSGSGGDEDEPAAA